MVPAGTNAPEIRPSVVTVREVDWQSVPIRATRQAVNVVREARPAWSEGRTDSLFTDSRACQVHLARFS